ncbi:hypothetical protein B6D60_01175 [candidate division KSB1 bacterium 4484_87]|nr:MAG: hypothetical protein B6D60_01175 [candidate division KSB1 bacterium 4484_87]
MGRYVAFIIMGFFISTSTLRMQANRYTSASVNNFSTKYKKLVLRNIANTGATVALNALTVNINTTAGVSNRPLDGGTYSYFIERQQDDPNLGPTEIRVTSISRFLGMTDTIIVLLTRPSFSRYAYFTNHEGNIWFATGDTIYGPCHTNTYFQMMGQPVFYGKVTSSRVYNSHSPYRKYYHGSTNPQFLGGTEWGVPELPMPDHIPQDLIDASQNGGIYISKRHVWIQFLSNGRVKIAAKNSPSPPHSWQYTTYNLNSINGVIYVNNWGARPVVRVKGTVNGNVTVGTRGYIRITDDIVYADDPRTNPSSNDMLGLVAERDVIVANNHHDQDRTIQASIMTLNPSVAPNKNFWVDRYKNDRYGRLHLLGGLIQNSRGAVGLVGSYWSRKGYLKDYHWDSRLMKMNPPYFPTLFALKKISWWE